MPGLLAQPRLLLWLSALCRSRSHCAQMLQLLRQTFKIGGALPAPVLQGVSLPAALAVDGPSAAQVAQLQLLLEQLLLEAAAQGAWRPTAKDAERAAVELLACLPAMVACRGLRALLAAAADLSDLWMAECQPAQPPAMGDSCAAAAAQQLPASFPRALMQQAALHLAYMPAETPLAATHVFEDAVQRLRVYAETHKCLPQVRSACSLACTPVPSPPPPPTPHTPRPAPTPRPPLRWLPKPRLRCTAT